MDDTQKDDTNDDGKLDGIDCENDFRGKNKKSKSNFSTNDNDSSDDELANDELEYANGNKLKSRKVDETEYDDPDEVDELLDGEKYFIALLEKHC